MLSFGGLFGKKKRERKKEILKIILKLMG